MLNLVSSSVFLERVSKLSTDIMAFVASNFDKYFAGISTVKVISIAMIVVAVGLFLFILLVLYVKSMVSFIRSAPNKKNPSSNAFFDDEDEENQRESREKERIIALELEEELELAAKEKRLQDEQSLARQQRLDEEKEQELEKQAVLKKEREEKKLDLDWKKGKLEEYETSSIGLHSLSMQYQQSKKDMKELIGLAIDMLGRGVDDLKIAQTIMYRSQGQNSEDDILQTIDAIKDFIALCINKKFEASLAKNPKLPSEERALYHLANSDPSLALALLESLMNHNIELGAELGSGAKRDALFAQTSNYACVFGSLANIDDVHLATSSFELAIELNSRNVNAWGRLGDVYSAAESHKRAIWAYENLLKMADEELNSRQIANARKMLSKYLYEEGDSLQAAKLYNSSKGYYDSIGINRRLDKKEIDIIEIIESKRNNDLESTIQSILQAQHLRQYSYVD